jgi:hypothetical protein
VESTPARTPAVSGGGTGGRILGHAIRLAPFATGPALIVLAPLIVLHGFWLSNNLSDQHVDLLTFWLPRWCFLGHSLRSGHVPTWLPHQFGGVPFASDPQSGWLYVPAMLLFTAFSCTRALGLFVALEPVLAGLGMYLFFRNEGLGRPAATVGGLTMSLTLAGSVAAIAVPFAGMLAWLALTLAGASGYLHARGTPRLLGWLALSEFALAQVASAHLTDGLLITAIVLVLYVVAGSVVQVRRGERSAASAIGMGVALVAAFPILAAAVLIPRLELIPRTSIGHGYEGLARLNEQLTHTPFRSFLVRRGLSPWWGTSLARGPGGYVGAVAIVTIPLALASRRWRLAAATFAASGLIGWLLNLDWLVRTGPIRRFATHLGVGELWLRDPYRFRYVLIVAVAGLSGYGMQAWLDLVRRRTRAEGLARCLWFLPGVAVFAFAPLIAGSPVALYASFGAALVVFVPMMYLAVRGVTGAAVAIPLLVAVELTTVGLIGQAGRASAADSGSGRVSESKFSRAFPQLRAPRVSARTYSTPGPIGRALIAARGDFGRYLPFEPGRAAQQIISARPPGLIGSRAAYEDGQSILFGIDEIQGYSPVQIDRYWRLVRAADGIALYYTAATFRSVRPEMLRLFGVEWVIGPKGVQLPEGATPVAGEGSYVLSRLPRAEPRASVVYGWEVKKPGDGLTDVLDPGFDPARRAIVETPPSINGRPISPPTSGSGTASYRESTPEHVQVRVTSSAPGLLVVRNAFDRNWQATVDGRSAPVLIADYLMQGVAVPPGTHTIALTYRDRSIGIGLAVSGVGWGLLGMAGAWLTLVERRRRSARSESDTR